MPNIPKPDKETLDVLAAAGYPDPGPPGLIDEAFPPKQEDEKKDPAQLLAEMVPGAIGGAASALMAAKGLSDASQTKSGISQYLIAGGGSQQSDSAGMNAVVSALNRLAGFKSRL
jgi:hypothetical protein